MATGSSIGRSTISAYIICFNEERRIRATLESVAWCDEIVVVDSGSTDATVRICREFTDAVVFEPWRGHVGQKNFALSLCRSDWCFGVDADEVVTPTLRQSIEDILASGDQVKENGFWCNRVMFHLGRWWRRGGWYPEYRVRMSRRGAGRWEGLNPHDTLKVSGPLGRLAGELHHFSYRDLTHQAICLANHARTSSRSLFQIGRAFKRAHLVINPLGRFLKFFLLRRGYRDGTAGFIVAVEEAHATFLKYAGLWELYDERARAQTDDAGPSQSERKLTGSG